MRWIKVLLLIVSLAASLFLVSCSQSGRSTTPVSTAGIITKWNGTGSDSGRGFFINSEKKYEEYKGGVSTVFSYQGYENTQKKMEAILADNQYSNDYIFNFYMIGDKIVYVGPNPGP